MDSMVEKAAEAVFWATVAHDKVELLGPYEFLREEVKERNRVLARAAIEAMHSPTPEMIEAGFAKLDYDEYGQTGDADAFNRGVCGRVFTAMIDAALTPRHGPYLDGDLVPAVSKPGIAQLDRVAESPVNGDRLGNLRGPRHDLDDIDHPL